MSTTKIVTRVLWGVAGWLALIWVAAISFRFVMQAGGW